MPDETVAPAMDGTAAQAGAPQPKPDAQPDRKAVELSEGAKKFLADLGDGIQVAEPSLVTTLGGLAIRWVEQELEKKGALLEGSVIDELEGTIARIDKILTDQVNAIIHHEAFRRLEGSWLGLEHLICRTMTTPTLQIRVMNISKEEIGKVFKEWKGTRRFKSPLYYQIYERMGGMPNGDPFACIVGDYEFDHSTKDIDVLKGMSQACAIAHAPFISAAAPSLFELEKWQDLQDAMDLEKLMAMPQYIAWNDLRKQQDSRYLGLTLPRFLARTPYSVKDNPIDSWAFDEDAESHDESKYVWSNAAYGMAANITRAFAEYGWCAGIRGYHSGGKVDQLPFHTFPNIEGGIDAKCPTEVAIAKAKEWRLSVLGLMPLSHWTNTTEGVFVGANSLKMPDKFEEIAAQESEELNCKLPYMFSACRFAHYLARMCYEWVGMSMEEKEIEKKLNDWMVKYKLGSPANATESEKHRKPLQDFSIKVVPVEGQPGVYDATFELRPHFQLEKLGAKLTLVSRVGRKGGG